MEADSPLWLFITPVQPFAVGNELLTPAVKLTASTKIPPPNGTVPFGQCTVLRACVPSATVMTGPNAVRYPGSAEVAVGVAPAVADNPMVSAPVSASTQTGSKNVLVLNAFPFAAFPIDAAESRACPSKART